MTAARRLEPPPSFLIKPAPVREPPFDDEVSAAHLSLVGPLDRPLPFAVARARESGLSFHQPAGAFPGSGGRADLPDVAPFARSLVIGVIEIATGRRPAAQLRWHTTQGVQAGLARDAGRTTRLGTTQNPAKVHSVHIVEPADGVAEVAAVVQLVERFRAVAFRLEGRDGRWRCVRLQIG